MNNYPPEGFNIPQPSYPLLCAHCGVVFGLSSGVTDGAVITCHHCGCQNQISLAKPGAEESKPIIRLIEQANDKIVPDTNICQQIQSKKIYTG